MSQNPFLPEWHPSRAVMLVWPFPAGDWQANYVKVTECYWSILQSLTRHINVWLLYHDDLDINAFNEQLIQRGIKAERVEVRRVRYNDTWVRDFGPISRASNYLKFRFNGWGGKYPADLDNEACLQALAEKNIECERLPFVCEGGALETNGSVLLMNANCVVDDNRNPSLGKAEVEEYLQSILGIATVAWLQDICLTGDDTDGHIDTIARFANESMVVYAGRNPDHPDANTLEALHQQIRNLAKQHQWQTAELPSPVYKSLLDGRILPCTYANFLICNNNVFAPVYGLPEDEMALKVLQSSFVGYDIIPVRCEALLEQHGSLHCATMQIAKIVEEEV